MCCLSVPYIFLSSVFSGASKCLYVGSITATNGKMLIYILGCVSPVCVTQDLVPSVLLLSPKHAPAEEPGTVYPPDLMSESQTAPFSLHDAQRVLVIVSALYMEEVGNNFVSSA